jgi:hypothetical protein
LNPVQPLGYEPLPYGDYGVYGTKIGRLKHHIVTFVINRKEIEPSVLYSYMFCGFNIFATERVSKIVTTIFQKCLLNEHFKSFRSDKSGKKDPPLSNTISGRRHNG